MKLRVIEEYELMGAKRYRVRVEGTNITLNVKASSPEEALEKARELAERIKLPEYLEYYRVKD